MEKRCLGCMKLKEQSPVCEHCGYNENIPNYPHQLPIGTVLRGQYIVGKVLGQGGFGITYIGWDTSLEAAVAIKEYYPNSFVARECSISLDVSCAGKEAEALFRQNRERFLREARVLAKLSSVPGIVRVHNLFTENNTAYIVMEYVEGIDLKRYIRMRNRVLTVEETFAVLRPVMYALSRVHESDLVHRDISPDNIMILPDGSAKLLDFGAVREVAEADVYKDLPQSTEAILKHGFAPIEQYRRRGNLGPWTDVYALCATMYYCLTGSVPADAPERVMGDDNVNWNAIPGLTPGQAALLDRGMALMPEKRVGTMEELRRGLFTQPRQAPAPTPEKEQQKKPHVMETRKKKKKPFGLIAAALAVVALVVTVGLFVGMPKEEPGAITVPEIDPAIPNTTEYTVAPDQSQRFLPEADAAECLLIKTGYSHADQHTYFTYFEDKHSGNLIVESENLYIAVTDNTEATITVSGLDLQDSYLVNTGSYRYQTEYEWEVTLFGDTAVKLYTGYRTGDPDDENREIPFSEMTTIFYAQGSDDIFDFTGVYPQVEYTSDSITWKFTIPEEYPDLFKDGLPDPFDFTTLKQVSVRVQEGVNTTSYCSCYNPSTNVTSPTEQTIPQATDKTIEPHTTVQVSEIWENNLLGYYPLYRGIEGDHSISLDSTKKKILSFTFLNTTENVPADSWDASENQDRSVLAWAEKNGDFYDVFIAADGGVNYRSTNYALFSDCSALQIIQFNNNFHIDKDCYSGDISGMFNRCSSLTSLDLSSWNTAEIKRVSYIFADCSALVSVNLSGWDISNIEDMDSMFSGCRSLTSLDLRGWNTSNVSDIHDMFSNCSSLTSLDLSSWDTSNVSDMRFLFSGCSSLTDLNIRTWDTSQVESMNDMFQNCSSLTSLDLKSWDTSNVRNTSDMFRNCISLRSLDLSGWDVSNVSTMRSMFFGCRNLSFLKIGNWNATSVMNRDTEHMFDGCDSLSDEYKTIN